MCLVAYAPRFADRKHAFVDATTEAAAWVVVKLARVLSRIVLVQPGTRWGELRQHFGGSHQGRLRFGVGMAGLRPGQTSDGLLQPVTGPTIAENRELCSE